MCRVSGWRDFSLTHTSRLSRWILNWVMSLPAGTPRTHIESIWAFGALNVRYEERSETRTFFIIICLDGFSLKSESSNSFFLERQETVSFMSSF